MKIKKTGSLNLYTNYHITFTASNYSAYNCRPVVHQDSYDEIYGDIPDYFANGFCRALYNKPSLLAGPYTFSMDLFNAQVVFL